MDLRGRYLAKSLSKLLPLGSERRKKIYISKKSVDNGDATPLFTPRKTLE